MFFKLLFIFQLLKILCFTNIIKTPCKIFIMIWRNCSNWFSKNYSNAKCKGSKKCNLGVLSRIFFYIWLIVTKAHCRELKITKKNVLLSNFLFFKKRTRILRKLTKSYKNYTKLRNFIKVISLNHFKLFKMCLCDEPQLIKRLA